jgi:hypothetical protein
VVGSALVRRHFPIAKAFAYPSERLITGRIFAPLALLRTAPDLLSQPLQIVIGDLPLRQSIHACRQHVVGRGVLSGFDPFPTEVLDSGVTFSFFWRRDVNAWRRFLLWWRTRVIST